MTEALLCPEVLLFARGVLALLDLWPALTVAVAEEWGGPESGEKKTWIASTLIDEYENRALYLSSTHGHRHIDPATANDPPLDTDDLGDMLNQMMSDEFDANVEDGSIDRLASDIIRLWKDVLAPTPERSAEAVVEALEKKAREVAGTVVKAKTRDMMVEVDEDDDDDESGSESEDDTMDVDEAPQLVPAEDKQREEPVVDDDGFTLVQGKGRKGR
ncbi:Pre-rRNA-processing protein TSR2-domain-containing protein [Naematelia encephala]|uniref:Pre-rRNA-processing protein TSR2-domain-containing protein n=1 Tax=Naematelia encephala TaxID=71784 RepID=A0A1Y2AG46_9TREE|nr:Pre-rRNA-processing protein TSR2-domain-containing protein [Naematelia encephala]